MRNAWFLLGQKNQAPTAQHATHDVYGVQIIPGDMRCFCIEESIGGGHAEQGGASFYSLEELLAYPGWKEHFELAGCAWAIPLIEMQADDEVLLMNRLVSEIHLRQR